MVKTKRRSIWTVALVVTLATAISQPASTQTVTASHSSTVPGDGHSMAPHLAAGGRYVVFDSAATNLVAGDSNGAADVFLKDLSTGAVERVSLTSDEAQATGESFSARVSEDGRFVTFGSFAEDLVEGDDNGHADVFIRDRALGTTARLSVLDDGSDYPRRADAQQTPPEEGGVDVTRATVADDGTTISFIGWHCQPGDPECLLNAGQDVVVRDRGAPTQVLDTRGEGRPFPLPAMTRDGNRVLLGYDHFAYMYDRSGDIRNVAVASDGTGRGDTATGLPLIRSVDLDDAGRAAAYEMNFRGTFLVPADRNRANDVFVRDLAAGRTERVSVGATGAEGAEADPAAPDPDSATPALSADGRFVAFASRAPNLVPDDANRAWDVFVFDRETGEIQRVSVDEAGGDADGDSVAPSISADGRTVAFQSFASDIAPNDRNFANDVFIRMLPGEGSIDSLAARAAAADVPFEGESFARGIVLDSAEDGEDDSEASSRSRGAEVVGASIVYRPELEDLFVRLPVATMPQTPDNAEATKGPAGEPGVVYALSLTVDGTRYEARASHPDRLELHRCAAACTKVRDLQGGLGTTDHGVVWSIPLASIGATEGTRLDDLVGFTGPGDAATGTGGRRYDEVSLRDMTIPSREVRVALVPAGAQPTPSDFSTPAQRSGGRFSGSVPRAGRSGAHDLVARFCWKGECAVRRAPVMLGSGQPPSQPPVPVTASPPASPAVVSPSPSSPATPTASSSPAPSPTPTPATTLTAEPASPGPTGPLPSEQPAIGTRSTSLTSSAHRTIAGREVIFSGVVEEDSFCDRAGVSLYRQMFGSSTYDRIAAGLPIEEDGSWSVGLTLPTNATYVATPDATSNCDPVSSDDLVVRVRVRIRADILSHCDIRHVVAGRLFPPIEDTNVFLGERVRGGWKRRDADRTGSRGGFQLALPECTSVYRVLWPKQDVANDRGVLHLPK